MSSSEFITIPNHGSIYANNGEQYLNQCFWISILDYLNLYGGFDNQLSIDDIRNIASDSDSLIINSITDPFDYTVHILTAIRIANHFGLRIEIYYCNYNRITPWISSTGPAYIFGNGNIIVPIITYGDNFELIIKSSFINLNIEKENDTVFSENIKKNKLIIQNFVPDSSIAYPKTKKIKNISDDELDKIIYRIIENNQHIHHLEKEIERMKEQKKFLDIVVIATNSMEQFKDITVLYDITELYKKHILELLDENISLNCAYFIS